MQSNLINMTTNFKFVRFQRKDIYKMYTLPKDWTPFDNAKKQISQATAKATAKCTTIPSKFSIPLLI